ncbi:hypothetical protein [Pedobacter xixiisoli]|nr:hypothetical protein [Pedobacter xixiisoli]
MAQAQAYANVWYIPMADNVFKRGLFLSDMDWVGKEEGAVASYPR